MKKMLVLLIIIFFIFTLIQASDNSNDNITIPHTFNSGDTISSSKMNDNFFKDSGIEQTWNFAHPENKKNTGPLTNFKMMIKGRSYQMLLNHLSHTITEVESSDKWAQFEVIILDSEKIYHKFNWRVEKYTENGPLKDCWLTTMVSSPVPLGSSI